MPSWPSQQQTTGWVLAVDFGTSNTGAAVRLADGSMDGKQVRLSAESDTMPSAVAYVNGAARTGQPALNARRTNPDTFFGSPKALLGREPVLLGDREIPPAEVVAQVLTAVQAKVVRHMGATDPAWIVLTHPADWGATRLADLRKAASLVGFPEDAVRLVPEPVAAVHHYDPAGLEVGSRVAVVDVGGGTSDVAVLEVTGDPRRPLVVIAQAGNPNLGGNNLDDLVRDWVIDELSSHGRTDLVDLLADPANLGAALTLRNVVRGAKQDLSEVPDAPVAVAVAGYETSLTLTRDEYEARIAAPMADIGALATRVLQDSGTTNLAKLYLTGGVAHTPELSRVMHKVTGILAAPLDDPKLAVARGALNTPEGVLPPAQYAALPIVPVSPTPVDGPRRVGPATDVSDPPGPSGDGPDQPHQRPSEPGPAPPDPVPTWTRPAGPGDVLDQRYELRRSLGRGGMGEVFLAHDRRFGFAEDGAAADVAVKVLHAHLAQDPSFVRRFRDEALTAFRLNHHNIVTVTDNNVAAADPGHRFIVMNYVDGRTLTARLAQGMLPVDQTVRIVGEILAALGHAHDRGVIHRDIKPDNIMLTSVGDEVKIMDFGLARFMDSAVRSTTLLGTADYVAPERLRGGLVDGRADLYSTGCLLYEALVGCRPFVGDAMYVQNQHLTGQAQPPTTVRSDLPPVVDAIVAKALAKYPEDRYQTAEQFRTALHQMVVPSSHGRFPPPPPSPDLHDHVPQIVVSTQDEPEPVRRLDRLDGIVGYWQRPASTAAEVAEVCRQIADPPSVQDSRTVRLSGIDWRVLDVDPRHGALLLAERVIGEGPYHTTEAKITWDGCDLRYWLNNDFCGSLGEPLTSRVVPTRLPNQPNPVYGTHAGYDTTDQFFLLSMEEAAGYLAGAQYVDWRRFRKRGWLELGEPGRAIDEHGGTAWWWLRSPGYRPVYAAAVRLDGGLYGYGASLSWSGGVRPAFWLSLEPAPRPTPRLPAPPQPAWGQPEHTPQPVAPPPESEPGLLPPDQHEGTVGYRTRAPSTAVEVAEVCRQIVGGSSQVRLSGIDWRVLVVMQDSEALLLSDRVVTTGSYHTAGGDITWEHCDLRRWLNGEFCWSLGEPLVSRVVPSKVRNDRNPVWNTPAGKDTRDQFFLLSVEEAALYLAGREPSDWKQFQDGWLELGEAAKAEDEAGENVWWWLRSPGGYPDYAATVDSDGSVDDYGSVDDSGHYSVSWTGCGVRPAFWLSLEP